MHLILDGHGALHAQVTRALRAAMLARRLGPGQRLPPTRVLARELGVSRNTVLTAYEQLRAEGFVDGRVGSGSYAAAPVAPPVRTGDPRAGDDPVAPPTAFARRLREFHDFAAIPGRTPPGARWSFQYGVPLANPVLTSAWARALSHAAQHAAPGYPPAQGLPALREAIRDYLARRRGIDAAPEDVLVVTGTQQALALTARVLVEPGAVAALEDPHYNALRTILQVHGARVVPVAVDGEGLRCDLLPDAPVLTCVSPSHQFPTGAVMSLPRRLALLDHARRSGGWIFEDDYDGEFRHRGRPQAALRALDNDGRVVYVGTFSKAMFPALRLGYLLMPRGLRRDFVAAKWLEDAGSPTVEQAALARFIADGAFERHLRRTAKALGARRAALLAALRACSRGRLEVVDSRAGMHLVVWLPGCGPGEVAALLRAASARGLALHPIAPYYMGTARAGLLMGYCGLSPAEIADAVAAFAAALDAVLPPRDRGDPP